MDTSAMSVIVLAQRQSSEEIHTKPGILSNAGFAPLAEVATFTTAKFKHFAACYPSAMGVGATSVALLKGPTSKLGDEHRLDPIVEVAQSNDGRILPRLDADFSASIV
jgi:hypothetical protein